MCANSQCVVIVISDNKVQISDSKLSDQSPIIRIDKARWEAMPPSYWFLADGDWYLFRDPENRLSPALQFNQGEYGALLEEVTKNAGIAMA